MFPEITVQEFISTLNYKLKVDRNIIGTLIDTTEKQGITNHIYKLLPENITNTWMYSCNMCILQG